MFRTLAVLLATACLSGAAFGAAPPAIDRAKLESYIRYADAFTTQVAIHIDDPQPSSIPGFFRLVAHLTAGPSKADKIFYLSADGKTVIDGSVWDLSQNPFVDTFEHLPINGPTFGPDSAKVKIVIFSDFECPYCQKLAKTIRDNVPQKYPKDVQVMFKDFPLSSIHPWAQAAAEAAHCLDRQKPGAFWTFHDWIFERQDAVKTADDLRPQVLAVGKQIGGDEAKLTACLDTHATALPVASSVDEGRALQIMRTPTMFINGRMVAAALDWDALDSLITMELNRPASVPAPETSEKCCEVGIPGLQQK